MSCTKFLGQYIPKKSLIHKLNPITKILVFSVLLTMLFLTEKIQVLIIISAFVFLLMHLTKISILKYIKINKVFIIFSAITAISSFLVKQCTASGSATNYLTANLESSAIIFLRLFLITMINSVFLFTTSSNSIINALEFILYPLKYFKVNIQEISLTTTMAIKFLPIIFEKFNKIMLSQKSRGSDFKTKNLFKRIKNYTKIFMPLLISTLRKTDIIASAMFSRCYSLDSPRTKFKTIRIQKYDIMFLLTSTLIFIGVIICNKIIK